VPFFPGTSSEHSLHLHYINLSCSRSISKLYPSTEAQCGCLYLRINVKPWIQHAQLQTGYKTNAVGWTTGLPTAVWGSNLLPNTCSHLTSHSRPSRNFDQQLIPSGRHLETIMLRRAPPESAISSFFLNSCTLRRDVQNNIICNIIH